MLLGHLYTFFGVQCTLCGCFKDISLESVRYVFLSQCVQAVSLELWVKSFAQGHMSIWWLTTKTLALNAHWNLGLLLHPICSFPSQSSKTTPKDLFPENNKGC